MAEVAAAARKAVAASRTGSMVIGIPREIKAQENRVALTPVGAEKLTDHGHRVLIQQDAGIGCGFDDEDYRRSGAELLASPEEIFEQADLIVKVKEPQAHEIDMLDEEQVVFTYFHFAADQELTERFRDSGATAVAYETVQNSSGELPLLTPMSEVAGPMAVQAGARSLEMGQGGRGVLLGGVPGVEPATVTILGGGVVGYNAARIAAGMGANVYILDVDINRLRHLSEVMAANVSTLYSSPATLRDLLPRTDLLIGAVLVVGAKAPHLVTRDMLSFMRTGSVIIDVAVDQGGCVETCHPTTHENPTYVVDGVVHYCVANMPGAVPNTSTLALTNSTLPYIVQMADLGCLPAMRQNKALLKGLNSYQRQITHAGVAAAFGFDFIEPQVALS